MFTTPYYPGYYSTGGPNVVFNCCNEQFLGSRICIFDSMLVILVDSGEFVVVKSRVF